MIREFREVGINPILCTGYDPDIANADQHYKK
jgi:hypothetical protein